METIISALKDLGEKKWVLNLFFPVLLFVGLTSIHYFSLTIGLTNLIQVWSGYSVDIKILIVVVYLAFCFLLAFFLDFATDSILVLFSGVENKYFLLGWLFTISRSYYLGYSRKNNHNYQKLAIKEFKSYKEQLDLANLEEELHDFPLQEDKIRSTLIGNILSAVVEYTDLRYGIDLRSTWARMVYSICPEVLRNALIESKIRLDLLLRIYILILIYTLLLCGYGIFEGIFWKNLPYLIICLLILLGISKWQVVAAKDYGELIRSIYDMHRFDLYESLRIPLPKKSGDLEIVSGKMLSEHLWRGTNEIRFSDIKKSE